MPINFKKIFWRWQSIKQKWQWQLNEFIKKYLVSGSYEVEVKQHNKQWISIKDRSTIKNLKSAKFYIKLWQRIIEIILNYQRNSIKNNKYLEVTVTKLTALNKS